MGSKWKAGSYVEDDGLQEKPTVVGLSLIVVAVQHLSSGDGNVNLLVSGVAGPLNPSDAIVGKCLKALGTQLLQKAGVPAIALPNGRTD